MANILPNIGNDPINPAYYAGTACAEIIEQMPTNVGFATKYAWRLGEKDAEKQEAGKAIWYLEREIKRIYPNPLGYGFFNFAEERILNAQNNGKLDPRRATIVRACVVYSIDGSNHHLLNAINILQTY